MYYHASKVKGLSVLEPGVSMHEKPLVYLSRKRENVLIYLSNAIEKFCRESGFVYDGVYQKWGPYGFDEDGIIRIEEYYPDALRSSMQGESGYIYSIKEAKLSDFDTGICDVVVSEETVRVDGCEFVKDAYEAILEAEEKGLLRILRYEDLTNRKKRWITDTIKREYEEAEDYPEYRYFLLHHFPDILKEAKQ